MAVVITVDVQNKVILKARNSTVSGTLPPFFGTLVELQVYPVVPNPVSDPQNPYISFDWTGYTVTAEIGTADASSLTTPAAFTDNFTPIAGGVEGSIDLNTVGIRDLIGTSASVFSTFEIKATPSGGTADVVFQGQLTLNGVVLDPGSISPPSPMADYILRAEALNAFTKKIGLAGETTTWTSPDGHYQVVRSIDNTGIVSDTVVYIP